MRYVHNLLWLGHGLLTVFMGLLLFAIEGIFEEQVQDINNGYNDAELSAVVDMVSLFLGWKQPMLWYGFAVCALIGLYHWRPAFGRLPMYAFLILHIPASVYMNWKIYAVAEPLEDGFYSVLSSLISSEIVLIVCLTLSWVYIMRAGREPDQATLEGSRAAPVEDSDEQPYEDDEEWEEEDEETRP